MLVKDLMTSAVICCTPSGSRMSRTKSCCSIAGEN